MNDLTTSIKIRGTKVPLTGLGTTQLWYHDPIAEKAMKTALSNGWIRMIDCAEMYGNGEAELAAGQAVHDSGVKRESLFIIDKILPSNADHEHFRTSLINSLKRVGTEYFDLYLLHWRENADLCTVVREMEYAKRDGLIKEWGVSNFDLEDMVDLFNVSGGNHCFADQVLYNVTERGPEYDLFNFLEANDVLPMSYSSLGSNSSTKNIFALNKDIQNICLETGISPQALMLSFNTYSGKIASIFSSSSIDHILEDLKGVSFNIEPYLNVISANFPAPAAKVPLHKI